MIAITTRSSINVKPYRGRKVLLNIRKLHPLTKEWKETIHAQPIDDELHSDRCAREFTNTECE